MSHELVGQAELKLFSRVELVGQRARAQAEFVGQRVEPTRLDPLSPLFNSVLVFIEIF